MTLLDSCMECIEPPLRLRKREELFSILIALKKIEDQEAETENYEKFLTPELEEYRYENWCARRLKTSNAYAAGVLRCVFWIGTDFQLFTEDEKRAIAELMTSAIKPIENNIKRLQRQYITRLRTLELQKRSALQYLIDLYGQIPVGDTILLKKLEEAKIEECIAILDDIIDRYRYKYDSSEGESDREENGVNSVPNTHHRWWIND